LLIEKKDMGSPRCQCLYEVENGMPRTKLCLSPCSSQKAALIEKNQEIDKIIEDLQMSIFENRYNKDAARVLSGTLSTALTLKSES
jgi:hypothetical protein